MSIRRRQQNRETNRIIQESLQQGYYPSVQSITHRLRMWLQEHIAGTPTFTVRPAIARGRSSPDDINASMEELRTDLDDIYSETKDQFRRVLANFDYNESERNRLRVQLDKLEARIGNLLLLQKDTDGYTESFYDTFEDFSKLDITQTSANIDLQGGQVLLPEVANKTDKLDLANATVRIKIEPALANRSLESPSNCFDDNLNSAWRHEVTASESQKVTLYFDVAIASSPVLINKVAFQPHSPKAMIVEVLYSTDGSSWTSLPGQSAKHVSGPTSWQFVETNASYLRFILTKSEPDDHDENGYSYIFGAKQVSVHKLSFVSEAVMVSLPHMSKCGQISQVAVEVDQEVPQGTTIEYFVSPYDSSNPEEYTWQPISHTTDDNPQYPKVIEFNNLESRETSTITATTTSYTEHGIAFYRFHGTDDTPFSGSERLYRGVRQWKRDHYYYIPTQDVVVSEADYRPTLMDWFRLPITRYPLLTNPTEESVTERDITSCFIDIMDASKTVRPLNFNATDVSKAAINGAGHYYLFTTNLYVEQQSKITAHTEIAGGRMAIYLNRQGITPRNVSGSKADYDFEFSEGWNCIQIVVYQHTSDANVQLSVDTGLDDVFDDLGVKNAAVYDIRAEVQPLTRTSQYNLEYNILWNDTNYYAIIPADTGVDVLVNHNPNAFWPISPGADQVDLFKIKYALHYRYAATSDEASGVIFMAIQSREPNDDMITPKLKSYRIKAITTAREVS